MFIFLQKLFARYTIFELQTQFPSIFERPSDCRIFILKCCFSLKANIFKISFYSQLECFDMCVQLVRLVYYLFNWH